MTEIEAEGRGEYEEDGASSESRGNIQPARDRPKHQRHHHKRRSGGRVHVSKMLHMTRTNSSSGHEGDNLTMTPHTTEAQASKTNAQGSKPSTNAALKPSESTNSLPKKAEEATQGGTDTSLEADNAQPRQTYDNDIPATSSKEQRTTVQPTISDRHNKENNPLDLLQGNRPKHHRQESRTVIPSTPTSEITSFTVQDATIIPPSAADPRFIKQPLQSKFLMSTPEQSPRNSMLPHTQSSVSPDDANVNMTHKLDKGKSPLHRLDQEKAVHRSYSAENLRSVHDRLNASSSAKTSHRTSMHYLNRGSIITAAAAAAQGYGRSRVQQKQELQRQAFLRDDENHPDNPRNRLSFIPEASRINREYTFVKENYHPMIQSLQRCVERKAKESRASLPKPRHVVRAASSRSLDTARPRLENRHASFHYGQTSRVPTQQQSFISRVFASPVRKMTGSS
ncbi:hypothetical protein BZG36_00390 [Bifiguratus adelaidae]|uniref:Uncharacterized protein n=1 Tax=Bifiguratus adelaidae TaxID=1938954 RepID=A0A261Y7U5_9FUNG|nr:hypothetical protein BZG36_00390 [Bifiguratus adelaidae]